MFSKYLVAITVPFILFLGISAGNIATWSHPQLWMIFVIVVFAGLWQPAYKPIDSHVPQRDRGTATQIVWTVYTVLIVSVVEAAYFRYPQSFAWDIFTTIGLALALSGLALRTWAFRTLGRHFTWHITVYDDHKVITDGPYRFVRHPSYTGAWILYSAIPFMLHSWVGFAISVVFQFFAYSRRIKHEEKEMGAKLGAAYVDYSKTVKTLVPFIW
jgi:protein-S-isoprenylcysteine O-methyltransferase